MTGSSLLWTYCTKDDCWAGVKQLSPCHQCLAQVMSRAADQAQIWQLRIVPSKSLSYHHVEQTRSWNMTIAKLNIRTGYHNVERHCRSVKRRRCCVEAHLACRKMREVRPDSPSFNPGVNAIASDNLAVGDQRVE